MPVSGGPATWRPRPVTVPPSELTDAWAAAAAARRRARRVPQRRDAVRATDTPLTIQLRRPPPTRAPDPPRALTVTSRSYLRAHSGTGGALSPSRRGTASLLSSRRDDPHLAALWWPPPPPPSPVRPLTRKKSRDAGNRTAGKAVDAGTKPGRRNPRSGVKSRAADDMAARLPCKAWGACASADAAHTAVYRHPPPGGGRGRPCAATASRATARSALTTPGAVDWRIRRRARCAGAAATAAPRGGAGSGRSAWRAASVPCGRTTRGTSATARTLPGSCRDPSTEAMCGTLCRAARRPRLRRAADGPCAVHPTKTKSFAVSGRGAAFVQQAGTAQAAAPRSCSCVAVYPSKIPSASRAAVRALRATDTAIVTRGHATGATCLRRRGAAPWSRSAPRRCGG